jgi:hypothetical protein
MQILIDVPDNKATTLLDVLRHISFITGIKSKKKPKNPSNPSPSGDTWFDDPENLRIVNEGIRDVKEGNVVRLEDSKTYQKMVEMCRKV